MSQLNTAPEGADAIQQAIANLDSYLLNGFVGAQYESLSSLAAIFAGTPLETRVQDCVQAFRQNTFSETHFVTLAALRTALQGTLYDVLRNHALAAIGRTPFAAEIPIVPPQSTPLLDSARHWLMEIAIMGFVRLERSAIVSFSSSLSHLRAHKMTAQQAALLTGFFHELLEALPVNSAEQVPLLRWGDLWSKAMLSAVGISQATEPMLVSGTLYPLGAEIRQHARAASLVVYGVLLQNNEPLFVRQTWSAFKATAIQDDDVWLLFPEAKTLMQNLVQGKAMKLTDMPMLPSGDLLWNEGAATTEKKFKPLDIAMNYCGVGKTINLPVPALERHPIQIAEPIALSDYQFERYLLHLNDGAVLALDSQRTALPANALVNTKTLFGLLRYDAGEWRIQVLMAGGDAKFAVVGEVGAAILKKTPKSNAVATLQERASRLLRKGATT